MSAPSLFYGLKGSPHVLEAGVGFEDAGVAIRAYAETEAIAPTGPSGDTLYECLYLALTSSMPAVVKVTPRLDGRLLEFHTIEISLPACELAPRTYQIPLWMPYESIGGMGTVGSIGMRGAWLSVVVEVASLAEGILIFDAVDVDWNPLESTLQPQVITP